MLGFFRPFTSSIHRSFVRTAARQYWPASRIWETASRAFGRANESGPDSTRSQDARQRWLDWGLAAPKVRVFSRKLALGLELELSFRNSTGGLGGGLHRSCHCVPSPAYFLQGACHFRAHFGAWCTVLLHFAAVRFGPHFAVQCPVWAPAISCRARAILEPILVHGARFCSILVHGMDQGRNQQRASTI